MAKAKAPKSPTPRSSANLTVSIGIVPIGISLAPVASSGPSVSGTFVCPQHGPNVKQIYRCSVGEKQEHLLERSELSTAYEHPDKPGELVVVDQNVLKSISEERSGQVEVDKFVDAGEIDPIMIDKTYLVWPQTGSEASYDVFAKVIREQDKAAVAYAVMSKATVMLVIRWSEFTGTLVAHTCRFHSQIRWADAELVARTSAERAEPNEQHITLAQTLVEQLVGEFDASEAVDQYTPVLEDAIRAAAAGTTFVPTSDAPAKPKEDLLDALMASVQATQPAKPKKRAAKA